MLDNIDWHSMEFDEYPGADLPPHYQAPSFPSAAPLGELAAGEKIYHGNCHCKAVRYSVKTKSLDEVEVVRCNCSLCERVCLPSPLSSFPSTTTSTAISLTLITER